MGSMQLARALNPRTGEEQVTQVKALPGATRQEVKLAECEHLARTLFAALQADPTVDQIIVSPQIIRQRDRDFDGLIITAIALVTRKQPMVPEIPVQRYPMVAPGWVRDHLAAGGGWLGPSELPKVFEDYLFRAAEQRNSLLEEWAEKMLVDGEQGIAMIQHEDQTMISLHPRVPFGHVFEFPSKDSFHAWADRGYPTG